MSSSATAARDWRPTSTRAPSTFWPSSQRPPAERSCGASCAFSPGATGDNAESDPRFEQLAALLAGFETGEELLEASGENVVVVTSDHVPGLLHLDDLRV